MTTPAPPGNDFAVLDKMITMALTALRSARAACARSGSPRDAQREQRAEQNLDALLEFRHAAMQRLAGRPAPDPGAEQLGIPA